jgi:hypothetical protein
MGISLHQTFHPLDISRSLIQYSHISPTFLLAALYENNERKLMEYIGRGNFLAGGVCPNKNREKVLGELSNAKCPGFDFMYYV